MLSYLWNLILYQPLLNALAFLVSIVPGGDVGLAVILLTILVKIILFPLSQHQIRNQAAMNILAPELAKIKKSGANKEEQARQTFALYKKHKTNPFSGCLAVVPTILVIIALYSLFIKGINFDSGLLYSFVRAPEYTNMLFLNFIDLNKASFVLAILAGLSQYLQAYFMPKPSVVVPSSNSPANSFQANFGKSLNMQMKYVFPFIIAFIAYKYFGIVALYLITSNIFTTIQQIYVNKTEKRELIEEVLNS